MPDQNAATIVLEAKPKLDGGATLNSMDFANAIQISVDDSSYQMSWGERSFQVAPGAHLVKAALKNLVFGQQAKTQMSLNLRAGEVIFLRYRLTGITVFSSGILEVDTQRMPAQVPPPQVQAARALPSCRPCGNPLAADAVFCNACGARQGADAPRSGMWCAKCGNRLQDGKFCPRCGGALSPAGY